MLRMEAWRPTVTRVPLSAINKRVPDPFERLFLQEYPKVLAIAYRVLADRPAAEDVAQEVFLKFHRSHSPDSERASGWLHAAAVHSALNVIRGERRRAQRETAHALDPAQPTIANPERLVEEAEQRREGPPAPHPVPPPAAAALLLPHNALWHAQGPTPRGGAISGKLGTLAAPADAGAAGDRRAAGGRAPHGPGRVGGCADPRSDLRAAPDRGGAGLTL